MQIARAEMVSMSSMACVASTGAGAASSTMQPTAMPSWSSSGVASAEPLTSSACCFERDEVAMTVRILMARAASDMVMSVSSESPRRSKIVWPPLAALVDLATR